MDVGQQLGGIGRWGAQLQAVENPIIDVSYDRLSHSASARAIAAWHHRVWTPISQCRR
jgi:hypothetical protein